MRARARAPQYTVPDTDKNYVGAEDPKTKRIAIRGATLLKVVEKLTNQDW